jgi:transglutaminase-like putative cysteine protease
VAGTLTTVDRPYEVAWRARFQGTETFNDLFAAGINGDPRDDYRADSLLSLPGEEELRAAEQVYPARIARNYLALPEDVSDRVRALANDLTATEVTPYDRALAIERYLRQFPYNLDLPAPPIGQEITDYFLFDLQQGYCDYYATAMVVLARAAGVPARLATGYVGGAYDGDNRRYTITADLAHSWPEIYFPGYGWLPFEPTAGRAGIERQAEKPTLSAPETGDELESILAARQRAMWQTVLRIATVTLTVAAVAIAGWWLMDIWRLMILEPKIAIAGIFSRMRRSGRRLDLGEKRGVTPYEYTNLLKEHLMPNGDLEERGGSWAKTAENIDWLAGLYTRSLYSPYHPGVEQRTQAIRNWSRLRIRLLWAVITSFGRKRLARFRGPR